MKIIKHKKYSTKIIKQKLFEILQHLLYHIYPSYSDTLKGTETFSGETILPKLIFVPCEKGLLYKKRICSHREQILFL